LSNKYNLDILVISCDAYSDVWDVFFKSFHKHWIDCPLKLNLLTNNKSYDSNRVNIIKVGEDLSWSDNLLRAIKHLNNDYVLVLLDDLLLKNKISNNYFNQISNWVSENNPNYLRLCISNKPNNFDNLVGKIPQVTPYKTSTMPCIWKKSILKDLLKEGESAWDFEINGSKRAYKYDGFYAVYNNFISYKNGIIKGKWRRSIIKNHANYGLDLKDLSRPIMTSRDEFEYFFLKLRSKLFNKFPNKLRSILKG
tara:strand:+ start:442 stop:1197 length:756 start_codon:yes stop_codon:yes gene_type:complete